MSQSAGLWQLYGLVWLTGISYATVEDDNAYTVSVSWLSSAQWIGHAVSLCYALCHQPETTAALLLLGFITNEMFIPALLIIWDVHNANTTIWDVFWAFQYKWDVSFWKNEQVRCPKFQERTYEMLLIGNIPFEMLPIRKLSIWDVLILQRIKWDVHIMSKEQMRCCLTKTIQMRCFILVMITNEMFEVTNEMFSGWPATCEMLMPPMKVVIE